jgi:aerobic-type carbon monoxide dehydrogenase small subunit (CoxS/CutS family)
MLKFSLTVNENQHAVEVQANTPLLWVLRDHLALTGTKYSCGIGVCGSCLVLIDNMPVRSCTTRIAEVAGSRITTIEGLGAETTHPVQAAWAHERVSQCGYCQPGQILSAVALLRRNPNPSDAQIDEAMRHNLCRCGTYLRVRRAIRRAAEEY